MCTQSQYRISLGLTVLFAWGVLGGTLLVFQGVVVGVPIMTCVGFLLMMGMCTTYINVTTGIHIWQSAFVGVCVPLTTMPVALNFGKQMVQLQDSSSFGVVSTPVLQDSTLYQIGLLVLWIGIALHVVAGLLEYMQGDEPTGAWKRNAFCACIGGVVLLVACDMLNVWIRTTQQMIGMQDTITMLSLWGYAAVSWTMLTMLLFHEQHVRGSRWYFK